MDELNHYRKEFPLLIPDWPAPASVRACSTTRAGGFSLGPYASLNLGNHVGDDPATVARNRQRLVSELQLPSTPCWLDQVHKTLVVRADGLTGTTEADGSYTAVSGAVCAVMTADCLPVLLCDRDGTAVAALHAGWRGLLDGVLEAGIEAMSVPANELMAWIGPAIGPREFEVGDEVKQAFVAFNPSASSAFVGHNDRWLTDLPELARQRLQSAGVSGIHGGHWCTYSDPDRFFSYRRERVTGRQATLIWLATR